MSTRSETYERELRRLVQLLRKKPLTAVELAERLGCSKPTVYARITALEKRGFCFTVGQARPGTRGPVATSYSLKG